MFWDNNVDDLDSFKELNSVSLSDDYDDDGETEVFDTSSSISDYEPDSTTHLPKKFKLPQEKTDSHSFVKKNTGYEFEFVMFSSNVFSGMWGGVKCMEK